MTLSARLDAMRPAPVLPPSSGTPRLPVDAASIAGQIAAQTAGQTADPHWHFERAGRLTASNAAAALGIARYKSRRQLWRELTGRAQPPGDTPAMRWGREHESDAIAAFEVRTGRLVLPCGFRAHRDHSWLGASPDGMAGAELLECKCPARPVPHRFVPDHYYAQMQVQLAVFEASASWFVSWTPEQVVVFSVQADPAYRAWMLPLLEQFWDCVVADREPAPLVHPPRYGRGRS